MLPSFPQFIKQIESFPQFTKKFENRFLSLCFHIFSNGGNGLSLRRVESERRSQFMIKLTVSRKNVNIIM